MKTRGARTKNGQRVRCPICKDPPFECWLTGWQMHAAKTHSGVDVAPEFLPGVPKRAEPEREASASDGSAPLPFVPRSYGDSDTPTGANMTESNPRNPTNRTETPAPRRKKGAAKPQDPEADHEDDEPEGDDDDDAGSGVDDFMFPGDDDEE